MQKVVILLILGLFSLQLVYVGRVLRLVSVLLLQVCRLESVGHGNLWRSDILFVWSWADWVLWDTVFVGLILQWLLLTFNQWDWVTRFAIVLLDLFLHILAQVDELLFYVGHLVDLVEAIFRVGIALLCKVVLALLGTFPTHWRNSRGILLIFLFNRFFLRFRLVKDRG